MAHTTRKTKRSVYTGRRITTLRKSKHVTRDQLNLVRSLVSRRGVSRKSALLQNSVIRNYILDKNTTNVRQLKAIVPNIESALREPIVSRFPQQASELIQRWKTARVPAKSSEFALRHMFEAHLDSTVFQPLLQYSSDEFSFGYSDEPFVVTDIHAANKSKVAFDALPEDQQEKATAEILSVLNTPRESWVQFNPTGGVDIEHPKFTVAFQSVVKDAYTIADLKDVPLYFIVYKRVQAKSGSLKHAAARVVSRLAGRDSHYSLMVFLGGKIYSIGFGMFGARKTGRTAHLPGAAQVGALYNPDYVIEGRVVGETSKGLPYKLDIVDVGLFKTKHMKRILEFAGQESSGIVATFDGSPTAAPVSSIITLPTMTYRMLSRPCPVSETTNIRQFSFNCTSFLEYVFRERIACDAGGGLIVHPEACRQRVRPPLDEVIDAVMKAYDGADPAPYTMAQIVEYLDAEV